MEVLYKHVFILNIMENKNGSALQTFDSWSFDRYDVCFSIIHWSSYSF